ncbi:MAG: zinc ribbon domain-containing protein [Planctomycetota bacterium]
MDMPIYEYACKACKFEFEELQRSVSDRPKARCPQCGSTDTERRISVFAARQAEPRSLSDDPPMGGCRRCGDPTGPCTS